MVHGILLLDKPLGISSHLAMRRAQRILGLKKAGHMGTLDVMASGMLPLCLGEATRFASWGLKHDKCYTVSAKMGEATSTGDVEGEVIERQPYAHLNLCDIQAILPNWMGVIAQIPPMHSALKHKGQPLYALARRGEVVERPARDVIVHDIELLSWDMPHWQCRIHAGSGLYVRTLIEDLAKALGSVAHVTALHRDWVAPWQQKAAVCLEELERQGMAACVPTQSLFQQMSTISLDQEAVRRLYTGLRIAGVDQVPGLYGLCYGEHWLGLGEVTEEQLLKVKRLLSNHCIDAMLML